MTRTSPRGWVKSPKQWSCDPVRRAAPGFLCPLCARDAHSCVHKKVLTRTKLNKWPTAQCARTQTHTHTCVHNTHSHTTWHDMHINIDFRDRTVALLLEASCWWWILKTSCGHQNLDLNLNQELHQNCDLDLDLHQNLNFKEACEASCLFQLQDPETLSSCCWSMLKLQQFL